MPIRFPLAAFADSKRKSQERSQKLLAIVFDQCLSEMVAAGRPKRGPKLLARFLSVNEACFCECTSGQPLRRSCSKPSKLLLDRPKELLLFEVLRRSLW